MLEERLMLCEDAAHEYDRVIASGLAKGVPAPLAGDRVAGPAFCGEGESDDR
jgi:hypothetical protein